MLASQHQSVADSPADQEMATKPGQVRTASEASLDASATSGPSGSPLASDSGGPLLALPAPEPADGPAAGTRSKHAKKPRLECPVGGSTSELEVAMAAMARRVDQHAVLLDQHAVLFDEQAARIAQLQEETVALSAENAALQLENAYLKKHVKGKQGADDGLAQAAAAQAAAAAAVAARALEQGQRTESQRQVDRDSAKAAHADTAEKLEKLTRQQLAPNLIAHGLPEGVSPAQVLGNVQPLETRRIGKPRGPGAAPRPLLVRCAGVADKHKILAGGPRLREQKVFLSDDLTVMQQATKRNLAPRFQELKAKGLKPFWRGERLFTRSPDGRVREDRPLPGPPPGPPPPAARGWAGGHGGAGGSADASAHGSGAAASGSGTGGRGGSAGRGNLGAHDNMGRRGDPSGRGGGRRGGRGRPGATGAHN